MKAKANSAACVKDDDSRYIHSRCHPYAPTWVKLVRNAVIIECSDCKKVVVRFKAKATLEMET